MIERVQGHVGWKMRRLGKSTASHAHDIVAVNRKGEPLAAYEKYLDRLAKERATGVLQDDFTSFAMEEGTRKEPICRARYSLETGYDVEEIEFIDHPTVPNSGASPDGIIRSINKFIEIKCPTLKTFLSYKETQTPPPAHICQIGWQFACMPEMKTCDYVVYSDEAPDEEHILIKTIHRNDKFVSELEKRFREFDVLVEQRAEGLRQSI